MTPAGADVRYVRLNRALHDLAAAIDTTEHAGEVLDEGDLRRWVAIETGLMRESVTSLQRDLEREVARR